MPWGKKQITDVALRSAPEDYAAFEAIGLSERAGARVLDVGCFDGFNTVLKFAPYASVERVVGVDPSGPDIACARERTDDARFAFVESTFEAFETDERFDVVYFSHVLQHLADPQAAMDKARRLLRPGGFVVVKTTDDAAKLSYPDPDRVMRRLFELYERHVLPNTPHTAVTDRYNGEKCYTYMKRAGLSNVRVRTFTTDTAEKSPEERRALYERCVYFRRNVPACVDEAVAREIGQLVEELGRMFERQDYYFSTASFVIIGQLAEEGAAPWRYVGPVFGEGPAATGTPDAKTGDAGAAGGGGATGKPEAARIRAMGEGDLGGVMAIEAAAFDAPWTPLAFAMDLRHNPCARYAVATAADGGVAGYIGWWLAEGGASIVRVAVDPSARQAGVGRALVEHACAAAQAAGADAMRLEVREGNEGARAFYGRVGFAEVGRLTAYYDDPPEDAVVMERELT